MQSSGVRPPRRTVQHLARRITGKPDVNTSHILYEGSSMNASIHAIRPLSPTRPSAQTPSRTSPASNQHKPNHLESDKVEIVTKNEIPENTTHKIHERQSYRLFWTHHSSIVQALLSSESLQLDVHIKQSLQESKNVYSHTGPTPFWLVGVINEKLDDEQSNIVILRARLTSRQPLGSLSQLCSLLRIETIPELWIPVDKLYPAYTVQQSMSLMREIQQIPIQMIFSMRNGQDIKQRRHTTVLTRGHTADSRQGAFASSDSAAELLTNLSFLHSPSEAELVHACVRRLSMHIRTTLAGNDLILVKSPVTKHQSTSYNQTSHNYIQHTNVHLNTTKSKLLDMFHARLGLSVAQAYTWLMDDTCTPVSAVTQPDLYNYTENVLRRLVSERLDQCIIVHGVSGSGKSTAMIDVLAYLAHIEVMDNALCPPDNVNINYSEKSEKVSTPNAGSSVFDDDVLDPTSVQLSEQGMYMQLYRLAQLQILPHSSMLDTLAQQKGVKEAFLSLKRNVSHNSISSVSCEQETDSVTQGKSDENKLSLDMLRTEYGLPGSQNFSCILPKNTLGARLAATPHIVHSITNCTTSDSTSSSRASIMYKLMYTLATDDKIKQQKSQVPPCISHLHSAKLSNVLIQSVIFDPIRPTIAVRQGDLIRQQLEENEQKFQENQQAEMDQSGAATVYSLDSPLIDSPSDEIYGTDTPLYEQAATLLNVLCTSETPPHALLAMLAGVPESRRRSMRLPYNITDAAIVTGATYHHEMLKKATCQLSATTRFTSHTLTNLKNEYEQLCVSMHQVGFTEQQINYIHHIWSACIALADIYVVHNTIEMESRNTSTDFQQFHSLQKFRLEPRHRVEDVATLLGLTRSSMEQLILYKDSRNISVIPNISTAAKSVQSRRRSSTVSRESKLQSISEIQQRIWDICDSLYWSSWETVRNWIETNLQLSKVENKEIISSILSNQKNQHENSTSIPNNQKYQHENNSSMTNIQRNQHANNASMSSNQNKQYENNASIPDNQNEQYEMNASIPENQTIKNNPSNVQEPAITTATIIVTELGGESGYHDSTLPLQYACTMNDSKDYINGQYSNNSSVHQTWSFFANECIKSGRYDLLRTLTSLSKLCRNYTSERIREIHANQISQDLDTIPQNSRQNAKFQSIQSKHTIINALLDAPAYGLFSILDHISHASTHPTDSSIKRSMEHIQRKLHSLCNKSDSNMRIIHPNEFDEHNMTNTDTYEFEILHTCGGSIRYVLPTLQKKEILPIHSLQQSITSLSSYLMESSKHKSMVQNASEILKTNQQTTMHDTKKQSIGFWQSYQQQINEFLTIIQKTIRLNMIHCIRTNWSTQIPPILSSNKAPSYQSQKSEYIFTNILQTMTAYGSNDILDTATLHRQLCISPMISTLAVKLGHIRHISFIDEFLLRYMIITPASYNPNTSATGMHANNTTSTSRLKYISSIVPWMSPRIYTAVQQHQKIKHEYAYSKRREWSMSNHDIDVIQQVLELLQTLWRTQTILFSGLPLSETVWIYDDMDGNSIVRIRPDVLMILETLRYIRIREMDIAAVQVQQNMKTLQCRSWFLKKRAAISRFQAIWKMILCRDQFLLLKAAVLKIESFYFTLETRRRYILLKNAVNTLKAKWKQYVQSTYFQSQQVVLRRLHALALSSTLRYRLIRQYTAAQTIQRFFRRTIDRHLLQWRQVGAALCIQAIWRGHYFRSTSQMQFTHYVRLRVSARLVELRITKLQANIRRRIQLRRYIQIQQSCKIIQRFIQTKYLHRGFVGAKYAVCVLQRFFRHTLFRIRLHRARNQRGNAKYLARSGHHQSIENTSVNDYRHWILRERENYILRAPKLLGMTQNKLIEYKELALVELPTKPYGQVYHRGWASTLLAFCRRYPEWMSHKAMDSSNTSNHTIPPLAACGVGITHTVLLNSDGRLFTFGDNERGQLGHNASTSHNMSSFQSSLSDSVHSIKPVQIGTHSSIDLFRSIPTRYRITSIAVGAAHTLALSQQGLVYAWGDNAHGQLGIAKSNGQLVEFCNHPTKVTRLTDKPVSQIAAGAVHSVALTRSSCVYCWGDTRCMGIETNTPLNTSDKTLSQSNYYANIRQSTSPSSARRKRIVSQESDLLSYDPITYVPREIYDLRRQQIVEIVCGWRFTLARSFSGHVFVWGSDNTYGQCGYDPTQTVTLENQTSVEPLVSTKTGIITVWNEPSNPAISIKASGHHSILLTELGHVYVWGDNTNGQCGCDQALWKYCWRPTRIYLPHLSTSNQQKHEYTSSSFLEIPSSVDNNVQENDIRCTHIAATWSHSLCVTNTGQTFMLGARNMGKNGIQSDQFDTTQKKHTEKESTCIVWLYRILNTNNSGPKPVTKGLWGCGSPTLSVLFVGHVNYTQSNDLNSKHTINEENGLDGWIPLRFNQSTEKSVPSLVQDTSSFVSYTLDKRIHAKHTTDKDKRTIDRNKMYAHGANESRLTERTQIVQSSYPESYLEYCHKALNRHEHFLYDLICVLFEETAFQKLAYEVYSSLRLLALGIQDSMRSEKMSKQDSCLGMNTFQSEPTAATKVHAITSVLRALLIAACQHALQMAQQTTHVISPDWYNKIYRICKIVGFHDKQSLEIDPVTVTTSFLAPQQFERIAMLSSSNIPESWNQLLAIDVVALDLIWRMEQHKLMDTKHISLQTLMMDGVAGAHYFDRFSSSPKEMITSNIEKTRNITVYEMNIVDMVYTTSSFRNKMRKRVFSVWSDTLRDMIRRLVSTMYKRYRENESLSEFNDFQDTKSTDRLIKFMDGEPTQYLFKAFETCGLPTLREQNMYAHKFSRVTQTSCDPTTPRIAMSPMLPHHSSVPNFFQQDTHQVSHQAFNAHIANNFVHKFSLQVMRPCLVSNDSVYTASVTDDDNDSALSSSNDYFTNRIHTAIRIAADEVRVSNKLV